MSRLGYPVAPPPLREPVISLIRAANDPLRAGDDTEGRWVNGIAYQPHDNTTPQLFDACDTTGTETPPSVPGVVEWRPYAVKVFDRCSTIGFRGHEFKNRLDMQLNVGKHKAVELEFWGGALAQSSSNGNAYLAETGKATDVTPSGGPQSITAAQLRLEQALSDCGLGGRGMIHCRPEALPSLTQVRREGNLLLTARDTIVVVGTGYPNVGPGGSAPAAGTTWLYATGMVDVWLDTDHVHYYTLDPMGRANSVPGGDFSDTDIVSMTNRSTNLITTQAAMLALASWDQQCWFACRANLGT